MLCLPALMLFHRLCYDLVGDILSRGTTDFGPLLLTPLDERIPYVPVFVLPYLLTWAYGLVILGYALYFRTYDRRQFRYLYLSFLLMTCLECLIWLTFPARISIRVAPEVLAAGWLNGLTAYVYREATPWNVFPSAHIAFAYATWLFSAHFARPGHRWPFLVLFLLTCLSVVLIKNHYLLDILGGVLLVQLVFAAFFLPMHRRRLLHGVSGTAILGLCLSAAILAAGLRQLP